MCVYIYIYIYVYSHVYIYIYIYIYIRVRRMASIASVKRMQLMASSREDSFVAA